MPKISQNGRMGLSTAWADDVKINHWGRARKFMKEHPESESPLSSWKRSVIHASWSSFPEVKETFNSADWYQGAIIFDLGGNNFRLIAICRFELSRLYIDKVLTHEEYDKGKWKKRYDQKRKAR